MALIKADRVKESSTSAGTGSFLLNGAYTGFRSFSSVCSVGDTFYYVIDSDLGSEWETGLGTYSATNTLTRTAVHSSSNSNSIVTFSAGTKNVYISLTGNQLGTLLTLTGSETLTNKTINASNNTITNVSLTSGVTGTLPLANGGTGTTTAQLAINALAGAVTSGSYLRGNGTNVVMAAISAGDVPTLNQNTTGTASGSVSGTTSYVPKFTSANVVGNSLIYDSGSHIGIGTTTLNQVGGTRTVSINGSGDAAVELNANNVMAGLLYGNPNGLLFAGYGAQGVRFLTGTTSAAATERMRIDTSGNVSIGTISPSGKLHVKSSASSTWIVYLQNSAGTYAGGIYQSSTNNTGLYLADSTGTDKVQLIAQSSTTSYINTGANFGIGTTSPSAQLHVTTPAAATKGLIVRSASAQTANVVEYQNNAGTIVYAVTYDSTYVQHASYAPVAGNNASIYCYGGPSSSYPYVGIAYQGVAGQTGYSGLGGYLSGYNNPIHIHTYSSHDVIFVLGNVEKGRLTTTGALSLNSGSSPGAQLHVTTAAAATKGVIVRGASAQSANLQEWQNNAGTALAVVDASGNVGIGTASPSAKLHVYSTASPQLRIEGSSDAYLTLYRNNVYGGYIGLGSTGNNDIYIYNLNSGAVRINNQAVYVTATNLVGINEQTVGAQLQVTTAAATTKGLIVKAASAQSANLQEWQNSAGSVLSAVKSDGSIQPASMADSAATNNSIYYSTTASKLVYKDAAGTVNNLY